jgi:hypothetical protein
MKPGEKTCNVCVTANLPMTDCKFTNCGRGFYGKRGECFKCRTKVSDIPSSGVRGTGLTSSKARCTGCAVVIDSKSIFCDMCRAKKLREEEEKARRTVKMTSKKFPR